MPDPDMGSHAWDPCVRCSTTRHSHHRKDHEFLWEDDLPGLLNHVADLIDRFDCYANAYPCGAKIFQRIEYLMRRNEFARML